MKLLAMLEAGVLCYLLFVFYFFFSILLSAKKRRDKEVTVSLAFLAAVIWFLWALRFYPSEKRDGSDR